MPLLLLIFGFIFLFWAFYRFMRNKHIYYKRQILTALGVVVSVLAFGYLALMGKLAWMAGIFAFWIPWVMRGIAFKAFLKRARSYHQNQQEQKNKQQNKTMSRAEALDILGLDHDASEQDIDKAYKRLISRVHPDLEGSTYLASLINAAKDCLKP